MSRAGHSTPLTPITTPTTTHKDIFLERIAHLRDLHLLLYVGLVLDVVKDTRHLAVAIERDALGLGARIAHRNVAGSLCLCLFFFSKN